MILLTRRAFLVSLLSSALVASSLCLAYPITPVPLWNLVERSDLIVLARVMEIHPLDRGVAIGEDGPILSMSMAGGNAVVRLKVLERWKGPRAPRLSVPFPAGLLCPAPPRYVEGETVLAYLRRKDDGWSTVALSYGTLYPHPDEIDTFRERVREAIRLQETLPVFQGDYVDWLIRAAEEPATRWHGLYPLLPSSDRLHSRYDQEREGSGLFDQLTASQIDRLADGFVAHPSTDRTLPMALSVLAESVREDVDRAAASAIEGLLATERPPWWLRPALDLVLRRFGDPYRKDRLASVEDAWELEDLAAIRRIWEEARLELSIPNVEPAPLPAEVVPGVGSDTPD